MKPIHLLSIGILLFALNATVLHAQEQKSARLSLSYVKNNIKGSFIKATVKYRENRQYFPASNLELNLYKITNQTDDDTQNVSEKINTETTNQDGEAYFYLNNKNFGADEQFYEVKIENDNNYEDNAEIISFKDVNIEASVTQGDSLKTIHIKLVDANNEPLENEMLKVELKRLFGNMKIGDEEFYETDEDGEIVLDIEEKLFSKSGNLEFIIKLDESEEYGTVVENLKADFGSVMESKDTFNERTMWASAAKAPLYILIIPNVLLVGIWGVILGLIFNLYRIYKNG